MHSIVAEESGTLPRERELSQKEREVLSDQEYCWRSAADRDQEYRSILILANRILKGMTSLADFVSLSLRMSFKEIPGIGRVIYRLKYGGDTLPLPSG